MVDVTAGAVVVGAVAPGTVIVGTVVAVGGSVVAGAAVRGRSCRVPANDRGRRAAPTARHAEGKQRHGGGSDADDATGGPFPAGSGGTIRHRP